MEGDWMKEIVYVTVEVASVAQTVKVSALVNLSFIEILLNYTIAMSWSYDLLCVKLHD